MTCDDGVIARVALVVTDLIEGAIYDRHTLARRLGVSTMAADRYIRTLKDIPGVVAVKYRRRLSLRFDFGPAIERRINVSVQQRMAKEGT